VTTDANSILMGSGAPAAKFDQIGVSITGTLTREPEAAQQTDFRTKLPETWKDGSPKMQIIVQLATTLRDPQRQDDDGTRSLYIKGKHLTDAIRQAVRQSGANGLHTGGQLTVRYIADGPAEAGLNPPKLYQAQYQPPTVSFSGVTQAAPVEQQAIPVSLAPAGSDAQAPAGVDPSMWMRLSPQQQAAVAAASSNEPPY